VNSTTSATITEIAAALGISQQAVDKKKLKHKWQPVSKSGVAQFDIETIAGLDDSERKKIKKICDKRNETRHIKKALKIKAATTTHAPFDSTDIEVYASKYQGNPDYNRRKADKYMQLLHVMDGLTGRELENAIEIWNQEHPAMKSSYKSLMKIRKKVEREGKTVLIGKYGNRLGATTVADAPYEYFKSLYMREGAGGADSCWRITAGEFGEKGNMSAFPSADSFMNRLRKELSPSIIYYYRHGFKKWNRKFGYYIKRDYSDTRAGECWVSDHAQIDIGVIDPKTGKPVFAWLTSWQDFKTGRILSAFYHVEAPNQEHVLQAFYMAAIVHGLPEYIYIDNGKDYRAKSVTGGRNQHRPKLDENEIHSLCGALNIIPIFAEAYNAQAKIIERFHLCIKTDFSMHCVGYRGGNVVERPEKLAKEIKAGALMPFKQADEALADWIFNVFNKSPSQGRLAGKSPEDAWNLENPVKRAVTKDALKLFCMRSSDDMTIGRNGVKDKETGLIYYAEWMLALPGKRVYFKRDVSDYNEAWFFDANTKEYLNTARIMGLPPALAKDEIGREQVKEAIKIKKHTEKAIKTLGKPMAAPDTAKILTNQKDFIEKTHTPVEPQEQKQTKISINHAEQTARIRKQQADEGKSDNTLYRLGLELSTAESELLKADKHIISWPSEAAAKKEAVAYWKAKVAETKKEIAAEKARKVTILRPKNQEKTEQKPEDDNIAVSRQVGGKQ